jgi:hypothetical protein
MESKNRSVWIAVAVVAVVACCGVMAVAAVGVSWAARRAVEWDAFDLDLGGPYRQEIAKTFEVGAEPSLDITNFAGPITIRAEQGDAIRVQATKKASSRSKLDWIEVEMTARGERVVIRTRKQRSINNASVELEIFAPTNTRIELHTGAGTVEVHDIAGRMELYSGAGTIDVRGAHDSVRVGLGAGQITYRGTPIGQCRFETGVGEISLAVPADADLEVDLGTGLGSVDVDFDVDGHVSSREVRGTIGEGDQGSVYAHTGVGAVHVNRR